MTKNHSTSRISHLKKAEIFEGDLSPRSFIGKNTLEVAHIFAKNFTTRFGKQWGAEEDILKGLQPGGRIATWSNLDKYINLFCKQFYQEYERHSEKIQFIDEARFYIQDLPQRQKYKLPDNKEEYGTPQEAAARFVTCSLCWRSVARRPLEKKTPLCHIHDIPCSDPEYRRRVRMKTQVEAITLRLTKDLPSLWELRQNKQNLNEYVKSLCLRHDGPLPHLVGYLQSLNLPLDSERDIAQALEYPIYYHKISERIKEAWNFYLEDRSKHFRLNYIKILTAEAWLKADAERRHGGKRC